MTGLTFQRARRTQARLRLALVAVSGAGKTMSALRLARGLVEQLIDMGVVQGGLEGKIAVIDTERASAALYADVVPFDTLVLEPPYSVDRYQQMPRWGTVASHSGTHNSRRRKTPHVSR